jgi:hypothetical protein
MGTKKSTNTTSYANQLHISSVLEYMLIVSYSGDWTVALSSSGLVAGLVVVMAVNTPRLECRTYGQREQRERDV